MTLPMNRLRNLAESYMPLSVEVLATTDGGTDPAGYPVEGEEYVAATTKGRLRDMSASESVVAQQLTEVVEGVLVCPVGTPVQSRQALRIDGVRYNVRGVPPATPQYRAQTEVLVSRA